MTKYRRNAKAAWRRVENEVLVVSSDRLTVLNDTAARVWELLDAPTTADAIAEVLSNEFEVESEAARRDVERLFSDLVRRGLVAQVDA